jgi:hypothetical protein
MWGAGDLWRILGCGCRSRYEGLEEVLVEEARDALVVDGIGWCGELDGEFGIGCGLEAEVGRCGSGEKELRGVQGGEGIEERKALVEEKTDGNEVGAWVAPGGG